MNTLVLTSHAAYRSRVRHIPLGSIDHVLTYGSSRIDRGAEIVTMGPREVHAARADGLDLGHLCGVEVVACLTTGTIITVYRRPRRRSTRIGHAA